VSNLFKGTILVKNMMDLSNFSRLIYKRLKKNVIL